MKTGDTVTDTEGRAWEVGQALGRGTWGISWVVRDPTGRDLVLKVALRDADFPHDAALPEGMLAACRAAVDEQAKLLREGSLPFLPRLEERITLEDGSPALLLPRYGSSLEQRLEAGASLPDAIALLVRIARLLEEPAAGGRVHGNLRPTNILIDQRGEVVLADALTPALVPWWRRLRELSGLGSAHRPPEAEGAPKAGWDAFALCAALYRSAVHPGGSPDPRRETPVRVPREGIGKVELAALKDNALARLKRDGANPRFAGRCAERIVSVLNRGLSREVEPSPPYRFQDVAALRPRLEEIAELVRPQVESVGRLLLAPEAKNEVFEGGGDVAFSVSVGCSAGITGQEDLVVGLQVRDRDADDEGRVPVPDARYGTKAHPSGRLRYDFTLPDLAPGRYAVRVAFAVKDSDQEPEVAAGDFEVRPPPGYVPPQERHPHEPVPLSFPNREESRELEAEDAQRPSARSPIAEDADVLPLPIAPSTTGPVPVEVEVEPTVAPSDPGSNGHASPGTDPDAHGGATPPAIAMPRPVVQLRPAAPDVGVEEGPTRPSSPSWSGPGEWEELPGADDALLDEDDPYLPEPDGGEDLPTFDERDAGRRPLPEQLEHLVELVRRDTWTAFMAALGSALVLLVFLFALLRACA